jgi:hypothetical protein
MQPWLSRLDRHPGAVRHRVRDRAAGRHPPAPVHHRRRATRLRRRRATRHRRLRAPGRRCHPHSPNPGRRHRRDGRGRIGCRGGGAGTASAGCGSPAIGRPDTGRFFTTEQGESHEGHGDSSREALLLNYLSGARWFSVLPPW